MEPDCTFSLCCFFSLHAVSKTAHSGLSEELQHNHLLTDAHGKGKKKTKKRNLQPFSPVSKGPLNLWQERKRNAQMETQKNANSREPVRKISTMHTQVVYHREGLSSILAPQQSRLMEHFPLKGCNRGGNQAGPSQLVTFLFSVQILGKQDGLWES